MLIIYVDPSQQDQVVHLSDRDCGYLAVKQAPSSTRYTFFFTDHAHPSFWCDDALTDGLERSVHSIDGDQRYRIEFC